MDLGGLPNHANHARINALSPYDDASVGQLHHNRMMSHGHDLGVKCYVILASKHFNTKPEECEKFMNKSCMLLAPVNGNPVIVVWCECIHVLWFNYTAGH